jgi:hypothetical protein
MDSISLADMLRDAENLSEHKAQEYKQNAPEGGS